MTPKVFAIATLLSILSAMTIGCSLTSDEAPENQLYQISTLASLSAGEYDGRINMDDLLEQGDFGVGTFDALDGEMVVIDGIVYQVPADGIPREVEGDVTTPFAVVTPWDPESRHDFSDEMTCTELQAAIDGVLPAMDKAYAIQVFGEFRSLTTRSEERQQPPYEPLATVLENQIVFDLADVNATFVGFRLPDYMAESNAAGYHFHAVTADFSAGGHVLDCQVSAIQVEWDPIDTWQVDLRGD